MDFSEIFAEYYSQFRGQGRSIPIFGDREFTTGIYLGNAAIRQWDRVDGQLWQVLIDTAASQSITIWPADQRTVVAGTVSYAAPTNMRKPPKQVRFYSGTNFQDIKVVPPQRSQDFTSDSSLIWFSGSANIGYTIHLSSSLAQQYDNYLMDFVYIRKPTMLTIADDPSAIIPDMSDPGFMIQSMLVGRFANSRNGFAIKIANKNASDALMNMKIEDGSGTFNNDPLSPPDTGWGTNGVNAEIVL